MVKDATLSMLRCGFDYRTHYNLIMIQCKFCKKLFKPLGFNTHFLSYSHISLTFQLKNQIYGLRFMLNKKQGLVNFVILTVYVLLSPLDQIVCRA